MNNTDTDTDTDTVYSQSDIYLRLSANIRAKIAASGLTQNYIAASVGASAPTFSVQLKYGTFKLCRLYAIANIVGCQIGDFFADEQDAQQ